MWLDLICFLIAYYAIHLVYSFGLGEEGKKVFETIVKHFHKQSSSIPLSFLLGFYVSMVMSRWWDQYTCIPGTTDIAVLVTSTIHGEDDRARMMRRTIMRYLCLSLTLAFRTLSPRVQKRFPNMSDVIKAGLINEQELSIIEDSDEKFPGYSKNWLPIVWAADIVTKARKEKMIKHDSLVEAILDKLNKFRSSCSTLISYNIISVPLVYTQVVTLAVYTYFLISLMGQQWIESDFESKAGLVNLDMIPVFMILQFLFYMGWFKVAETLMNPFGEDDDDFEVNCLIDRNLQISYQIVDEMRNEAPELTRDIYWNKIPKRLNDPNDKARSDSEEEKTYEPDDTADYSIETDFFLQPSIKVISKLISDENFIEPSDKIQNSISINIGKEEKSHLVI